MLVLGIETSCDETGVALVEDGRRVRSNVLADQQTLHARYGGVVPEVASRAHVDLLHPAVEQACALGGARLSDVDAVAVTIGPGLAGSLLVGVAAAKAYALALDRPLAGVNHLVAHVYANVLDHGPLPLPAVVFVVSGGHTSLLAMDEQGEFRGLGQTIDDAAGEAFDKSAKLLGLGYPGGPALARLADFGDPLAYARAWRYTHVVEITLSTATLVRVEDQERQALPRDARALGAAAAALLERTGSTE